MSVVKWLRTDWVHQATALYWRELKAQIAASKRNYFRDWIAFDAEFSTALLEVEINANSLLNSDRQHSNADVSLDKINHYLIKAGASLPVTPAEEARIYRFTTSRIFVEAGGGGNLPA